MTSPPPRSKAGVPAASQVSPCGEGTDSLPYSVQAGGVVRVSWTQTGNDGGVYILLLDSSMTVLLSLRNFTLDTNLPVSVRIPSSVSAGTYYLQWRYQTYFSCSLLNVSASTIVSQALAVNSRVDTAVPVNKFDYYEIHVSTQYDDRFLEISGTGPSGITNPGGAIIVVGKETNNFQQYPTENVYDNTADTYVSSNYYFTLCRDNNGEDDFVVGVKGTTLSTGSYSLTATTYSPNVNANQALSSTGHNGKKHFTTEAYSTEIKRRMVVTYDTPFTDIPLVRFALNCAMTNQLKTVVEIDPSTVCVDLPTTEGTKFLEVPPTTDSYSVSVLTGTCKEGSDSSILSVSVILVALLSVLFM